MASNLEVHPGEIRYPDVLLGRGQAVHHHAGNVAFRKEVRARSLEYDREGSALRNYITKEIIRRVNTAGGRFLKPVKEGVMLWVECPEQVIRTKVKQALRDDAKKKNLCKGGSNVTSLASMRNPRKSFDKKSGEIDAVGPKKIPTSWTAGDHLFLNGHQGREEFTNQSTLMERRLQSNDTRMNCLFGSPSFTVPRSGLSSLVRDSGSVAIGLPQTFPHQFDRPLSQQELVLLAQNNSNNPFTSMTRTQLYRDYLIAEYLRNTISCRSKSDEGPFAG